MENIQLITECIKESSNIGNTIYQNVCNGNISIVFWGSLDWLNFGLIIIILGIFVFILHKVIKGEI